MRKSRYALIAVALVIVTLSLINASWLAGRPAGRLSLIAHRGSGQPIAADAPGDCNARHVRPGQHGNLIENSAGALTKAMSDGANGLMLDVRATSDGHAVIFRDARLECRTNGTGAVAERDLSYLRTLDIGYGYSQDNGRTFPLRGLAIGAMPTVYDVLRSYRRATLIFDLADARAADATVAAFRQAGVEIGPGHGFAGPPAARARLRQLTQSGFVLDNRASEACMAPYYRTGWLGTVPEACNGTTLILSRHGSFTLWGWPYRFLARMSGAGARFFIPGDGTAGDRWVGLTEPEQLGEVPHDYTGMLLVEDMENVGRALVR
ncbi:MAG TPA: glycerophosphodiester phosphodiesterase family protein [Allosphingosinicella sp.]|nr:glycerophosphodiester phosphodiesterase family protein [Allosphingosinicella sp.]